MRQTERIWINFSNLARFDEQNSTIFFIFIINLLAFTEYKFFSKFFSISLLKINVKIIFFKMEEKNQSIGNLNRDNPRHQLSQELNLNAYQ